MQLFNLRAAAVCWFVGILGTLTFINPAVALSRVQALARRDSPRLVVNPCPFTSHYSERAVCFAVPNATNGPLDRARNAPHR